MKNNFYIIFFFFLINFLQCNLAIATEEFNFDITEVEIKENGNKFFGNNGGVVTTTDGLYFEAENFIYDKIENILYVEKIKIY